MNLLKYRIKTFFKYQDLVRELVQRDLKLKYRRSFLGYLWSVLNPLLIMIVLTVVFSNLFNNFSIPFFTPSSYISLTPKLGAYDIFFVSLSTKSK